MTDMLDTVEPQPVTEEHRRRISAHEPIDQVLGPGVWLVDHIISVPAPPTP